MEKATSKIAPFDPKCTHVENGMITANNPDAQGIGAMDSKAQFDTGFSLCEIFCTIFQQTAIKFI